MTTNKAPTKTAARKSAKTKPARASASAADEVDKQLARYRDMRDFSITSEPSGSKKKSAASQSNALPFVIQKHAASHLHYDFRLGWNGVLKSWACAKGPSFNTKDRRLAVQVEDHPIEYGGFEGIIPAGQYGGGTVMVWDQGTWAPQPGYEDVTAALREGHLKFTMDGTKMHGNWALVRMADRAGKPSSKPNWLLIKEHDDFERFASAPAITDEAPNSVVTNRSLEQIASAEDHVWNSKDTAKPGRAWHRSDSSKQPTQDPIAASGLKKLPRETQPDFLKPQLALEAIAPPTSGDWLYELKLDGYRVQARKSGSKVALLTRSGLDWTHRMPTIASAIAALPAKSATLDGEVVVLGPDGNSSFAELQAAFENNKTHPLTYFVFDLLHLDGHNTRTLPLRERKQLLTELLTNASDTLRLSEDIEGNGETIFHNACKLHAEGIICKQASAPYTGTRSRAWLKCKCLREQELIITGYTLATDSTDRIGALLLGYYQSGKLIYAGRTGTGFTQKLRADLLKKLSALKTAKPPFATLPSDARRGVTWTKPTLVAQVRFATWTADNLVRQAAFLGLREDKSATEVTREEATVAPTPKHNATLPTPRATAAKVSSTTAPTIRLTHPDKVLDPTSALTKQQLADYYLAVAEHMLPHIADRPLSLVRCPDGCNHPCFFQKHVNAMLPKSIGTVEITDKKTGKPEPYITLNSVETLVSLAQLGVMELHPWGSRNADLEHPDRLIFDLDPSETVPWSTLSASAALVRKRLKAAGLESFLKLTGGKGLHIVAPIQPTLSWSDLNSAAHNFVLALERDHPDLYLTKMTKSARKDKIYLDYLRNERGATAVAPFSPRARPGVHVSLPLPWSALKLDALPVYSAHDLDRWSAALRTDPWKAILTLKQTLNPKAFD